MPATLKGFVFAAAIAWMAVPAWGAGMPDYGTKNFSPGGATPSYFTNENSAALGIPENDSLDDGADAPLRSAELIAEPRHSDNATRRHRGGFASRKSQQRGAALRVRGHAPEAVGARHASLGRPGNSGQSEHASRAAARTRAVGSGAAKSGKLNPRHAAARTPSRKG